MRIAALRLFNVKRFAGRGVAIEGIGDGVNVLCAPNEFGKSTSFEALHAIFFQPHSGTPGDVQRLRPYSGGSPLVEVDIETGEGRFRITKRYYGGRFCRVTDLATGRLVAQADEAEAFVAGLVRGGTAGPAGLLWVRQGVTGMERRTKSETDSEKQIRATLLESVQGEVEAITGGRRMAEVLATTKAALSQLVTAGGKARSGGPYLEAIEVRDGLAAEERRLSVAVADLRDALRKRSGDTGRLAELDRPESRLERRQAIAVAEAALDAVRAQREMLRTAEIELTLLRERREAARREQSAHGAALAQAHALRGRLVEAERLRDDASRRRGEAAEAIEAAMTDAETAQRTGEAARDRLARADAALRAREAWERLADLETRLRDAEAVREATETGEAELALARIAPEAVDELQTLEIELATLRAVEEADRPSIAIEYVADAAAAVTMDGTPLRDGEERTFGVRAELSVPGIGSITLRANRPPRRNAALERAGARREALLTAIGVADLASARERQARAARLDADLRVRQARLSLLAPDGLARLREEVAARSAIDPAALELKEDPARVRAALADADERRRTATLRLREAEPARAAAEQAFVAAETTLATTLTGLAQAEAILGPAMARDERGTALGRALEDAERALSAASERADGMRAAAADLAAAEGRLARLRSAEAATETEIGALRESVAGLNAEIRARSEEAVEEAWRETSEALAAAARRVAAFETEVAVLQRLAAALESARAAARDLYLKPVVNELGPLLGLLFDDVSITFDDATLLPHSIRRNGQDEEVERLSGGMREQLSVLTRLAFARLLARAGRPAPVILDDALVYSDDDRIERMFDALHRQSRDQQIIVFSCRQRAFQTLGGTVLRMTEWQP